jgi:hypothetical protein
MEEPVKWEIEREVKIPFVGKVSVTTTMFSMNTYGGWDVGYDYHFNYSFGEGIHVASDGWSNPELMTRSDLDIGAKAWLNLTGPGVHIDFWKAPAIDIDLLALLAVGAKIDEAVELTDATFTLPFLEDNNPLVSLQFESGIYADNYGSKVGIDYEQHLLSIHSLTDSDYFELDTAIIGNGAVTIDILFDNIHGDLDLHLTDPNGSEVAQSISTTDNERIEQELSLVGNY